MRQCGPRTRRGAVPLDAARRQCESERLRLRARGRQRVPASASESRPARPCLATDRRPPQGPLWLVLQGRLARTGPRPHRCDWPNAVEARGIPGRPPPSVSQVGPRSQSCAVIALCPTPGQDGTPATADAERLLLRAAAEVVRHHLGVYQLAQLAGQHYRIGAHHVRRCVPSQRHSARRLRPRRLHGRAADGPPPPEPAGRRGRVHSGALPHHRHLVRDRHVRPGHMYR